MTDNYRDMLVRDRTMPLWKYTGPLKPAQEELAALMQIEETKEAKGRQPAVLSYRDKTPGSTSNTSVTADSLEDAWRSALGSVYAHDQPFPDFAKPGESIVDYRNRLGSCACGSELLGGPETNYFSCRAGHEQPRLPGMPKPKPLPGVTPPNAKEQALLTWPSKAYAAERVREILEEHPEITTASDLLAQLEAEKAEHRAVVEKYWD